jgi:hypothetical protein
MSFALGSEAGEVADVPRKLQINDGDIHRSRAMAFYRQRLDGLTDGEIGQFWGRSRQHVNSWINALTSEQRAMVRRERIRAIRADALLREEESADAI